MASKSTSLDPKLYTDNVVEAVQRLDANEITELLVWKSGGIRDSGATSISNSLIKNTSLTHLDLQYNKFSDSGATSISHALIKNTSLIHLDLSSNSISESGVTSISNLLIKNTSLKRLYLWSNLIRDRKHSVNQLIANELAINAGILQFDFCP